MRYNLDQTKTDIDDIDKLVVPGSFCLTTALEHWLHYLPFACEPLAQCTLLAWLCSNHLLRMPFI